MSAQSLSIPLCCSPDLDTTYETTVQDPAHQAKEDRIAERWRRAGRAPQLLPACGQEGTTGGSRGSPGFRNPRAQGDQGI